MREKPQSPHRFDSKFGVTKIVMFITGWWSRRRGNLISNRIRNYVFEMKAKEGLYQQESVEMWKTTPRGPRLKANELETGERREASALSIHFPDQNKI